MAYMWNVGHRDNWFFSISSFTVPAGQTQTLESIQPLDQSITEVNRSSEFLGLPVLRRQVRIGEVFIFRRRLGRHGAGTSCCQCRRETRSSDLSKDCIYSCHETAPQSTAKADPGLWHLTWHSRTSPPGEFWKWKWKDLTCHWKADKVGLV